MESNPQQEINGLHFLRKVMNDYYAISDKTFETFQKTITFKQIKKGTTLCAINEVPKTFYFVCTGLLRVFILDEKGNEYNKTFFDEGTFPGSMVALLNHEASQFEIEALEDCILFQIDFKAYRALLDNNEELKWFQIHYLEKHWLIQKEQKEVALVQEDAASRYERFKEHYPNLESRLTQYHIASHLGITPTQLSRIRKNQHM